MPAVKLVNTKELTKEQWLEVRKSGVTGSRIAAIMGKNPYETPLSVYCTMKGLVGEKEQTEAMYFGTALEDFVAKEFAERTGLQVDVEPYMLQHPTYEFMLANIDRVVTMEGRKGILECKNVSAYQWDVWKVNAPEMYQYQLQWYLGITGYEFGFLAALVGGQRFVFHMYERNDELIKEMQQIATDFWFNHIMEDIQPDITSEDGNLLSELYSDSKPGVIAELPKEKLWLIEQVKRTKIMSDDATSEYKKAQNEIKSIMGSSETLHCDGEVVATWKANKNGVRSFKVAGVKE